MSMTSEQVRRLREFAKTLTYADEHNLIKGAADTIEELSAKLHASQMERSSQYYNGGWIPVSERTPDVDSEVLVCFDFKGKRSVHISHFYGDGEFHGLDDEYLTSEGRKYRKAVAWMQLPDPWKGDKDG